MDNMTNLTYDEFKYINSGSNYKYIDIKKENEKTYCNNNNKKENIIYSITDMKNRSEHLMSILMWDIGRGDFVGLGNLEIEMNKMDKI
jgi:hypothetical protein